MLTVNLDSMQHHNCHVCCFSFQRAVEVESIEVNSEKLSQVQAQVNQQKIRLISSDGIAWTAARKLTLHANSELTIFSVPNVPFTCKLNVQPLLPEDLLL